MCVLLEHTKKERRTANMTLPFVFCFICIFWIGVGLGMLAEQEKYPLDVLIIPAAVTFCFIAFLIFCGLFG